MLYEVFSLIFGIIKILLFKLIYFNRIKFKSLPKMNNSFKMAVKKNCTLNLGKNFKSTPTKKK